MRIYYVYTHSINGNVFYVGKGRGNRSHQTRSRNRHWHNVVSKYGQPTIQIVKDNLTDVESYDLEKKLISEYGIDNLTNISEGGPLYGSTYDKSGKNNPMFGKTHSDIAKKRIGDSKRDKKLKPFTDEHKSKIANSLQNLPKSPEAKINMSKSQQNIKPQTCPHCGKVGTHNMKRYHFDKCPSITGISNSPTWTKGTILVVDTELNQTQYSSMAECARILKIDVHGVSDHIKNGTTFKRGIYKGYKFTKK